MVSNLWVGQNISQGYELSGDIWQSPEIAYDDFTEQQQAHFDKSPERYQQIQESARVRVLHRRYAEPFLRKHVPPRGVILEIGSGGGSITSQLIRPGEVTIAADISLSSLRFAAARLKGRDIACVQAAAQNLPFPAHSCDAIVSYAVLHHLSATVLDAALSEISRLLKPGGQLLAIETGNTPPWPSFWVDLFPTRREMLHRRIRKWAEAREARHAAAGTKHPSVLPAARWQAVLQEHSFSVEVRTGRLEYLPWRFKYSKRAWVVSATMRIGDALQYITGAAGSYVMLVATKPPE